MDVDKASHPDPYTVRLTSDGLHLDHTILWFDSIQKGQLSFLSSAATNSKLSDGQVISTEETLKILEVNHKKPHALVCQYNRPFSIGNLTIELIPSGSVLGGASLHVETGDKKKFLYAPSIQIQKNATVRKFQMRKVDTLLLGACHPDPNAQMPNRKKECEKLVAATKEALAAGVTPIILCKPMPTAQEITKLLTDAQVPVAVHDKIFKINRTYESLGSSLGNYTRLKSKKSKQRAIILPILGNRYKSNPLPKGAIFYIEDTMTDSQVPEFFTKIQGRFYIGSTADGRDIREFIQSVDPKVTLVFGPYAKRYVDELKTTGREIKPLYRDDQPTLF